MSRLAKALCLFLCIAAMHSRTIAFVIYMTDFTAKTLQVIHFVIRCEAKFFEV